MDFSFSEDQELMIDSIKEFAATYFTDEAVKEMYEVHHGVPDEVQDAYRDLGFASWVCRKRLVAFLLRASTLASSPKRSIVRLAA